MHLGGRALEELAATYSLISPRLPGVSSGYGLPLTADEERVAGKHSPLVPILHVEADAVLRMARGVDALDDDAAKLKRLFVLGGLGDALAILAADDLEAGSSQFGKLTVVSWVWLLQLSSIYQLLVPAGMVPVAKRIQSLVRDLGSEVMTYWCVFTMAVSLMSPACMASFKTGATLHLC